MRSSKHCLDWRRQAFLGIECAWPATQAFPERTARGRRRTAWAQRAYLAAVIAAMLAGLRLLIA